MVHTVNILYIKTILIINDTCRKLRTKKETSLTK